MDIFKWFRRNCPGEGKYAQRSEITWDGKLEKHYGSCPECGRVRECDGYAIMLQHRK